MKRYKRINPKGLEWIKSGMEKALREGVLNGISLE
jgi:hypothetical protein